MEKHLEKLTKITVAATAGFAGAAVVSNISPVHADEMKDQVVDTKPQPKVDDDIVLHSEAASATPIAAPASETPSPTTVAQPVRETVSESTPSNGGGTTANAESQAASTVATENKTAEQDKQAAPASATNTPQTEVKENPVPASVNTSESKAPQSAVVEKEVSNKELKDTEISVKSSNQMTDYQNRSVFTSADPKVRSKREVPDPSKEEIDKENQKLREKYDQDIARYYAEFSKTMSDNMAKQEAYNKAYSEYLAQNWPYEQRKKEELRKAEENKNKEGYLSEVKEQYLQFKNETEAKLESTGGTNVRKDIKGNTYLRNEIGNTHTLKSGESVTATYTNLKNSSYAGKKITKVVYTLTYVSSDKSDRTVDVTAYHDPTKGFYSTLNNVMDKIKLTAKFYYEDGSPVTFSKQKPALFSLSSLNNNSSSPIDPSIFEKDKQEIEQYFSNKEGFEYAQDFSGEIVSITGSTIKKYNNRYFSENNNSRKRSGSKYEAGEYDYPGSGKEYYAATVGVAGDGDSVSASFGSSSEAIWASFNSDIKATGVVENNLNPPSKPSLSPLPKAPTPPVYKTYTDTRKQNKKYVPHSDVIVTEVNTAAKPEDGIGNKEALPSGTTYSFVGKVPDVTTPGIQTATVRVTYPDKTTTDVPVRETKVIKVTQVSQLTTSG
ncbi:GbpC/Spa domain-containing protein, partial [Streptococcus sp. HMSC067A03]|uniref:GbpC/Spa domain-containing protein n=1 Tax=Streptococcus sp. HMSC067A03 TaxID=1739467 RepID=UPI000AF149F2